MRTRMAAACLMAVMAGAVMFAPGQDGRLGQGAHAGGRSTAAPSTWSAEFMDGSVTLTREQAVAQAKAFDTIAATKGMYRSYVGDMKAANPDLRLLVYLNGSHAQKDQGTAYPDGWYERDANGKKVTSGWGNYLMNPAEPGWTQDVIDRCNSFVSSSGYDGCFLDTMGTAPVDAGYESGVPIDPATGKEWTRSDWIRATSAITAAVRDAMGGRPVYANGIANGSKYLASDGATSALLGGGDGAMVELFVRAPYASLTTYRSEAIWKRDVDMLVDAAASGRTLLTITKVWRTATQDQKDAIHRYAFATFLLGATPGLDRFAFRYDHSPVFDHPYWHVPIGEPTGGYAKVDGAYQRPYSNGLVLVNPGTSAVTVPLPAGSFATLTGAQASGSITLAAHTGEVLTLV